MGGLHLHVAERAVAVTLEQARWLAGELRALRPLDPAGAAAATADAIEESLAAGSAEVDVDLIGLAGHELLMALEALPDGPEPFEPLQELHDVLVDELTG